MSEILQLPFVIALFALVRSGDLAISSAIAHDIVRAVCYGIVAMLILTAVIISLGIS
jgi:hypothetical protein